MVEFLGPILKAPAVVSFVRFVRGFGIPFLSGVIGDEEDEFSAQPDLSILNCRVELTRQRKGHWLCDAFSVEICGTICAPGDMHYTTLQIVITDITDGLDEAEPVRARVNKWQALGSSAFCYDAELGKLPNAESLLSDWVSVAQIPIDRLEFARRGTRQLRFSTSILSRDSGQELACAVCDYTYENYQAGYIDLEEKIQLGMTLAVGLALAVGSAKKPPSDAKVEFIRNWAMGNIDFSGSEGDGQRSGKSARLSAASEKSRRKFEKDLDEAVAFFRDGKQIDTYKICRQVLEITPVAECYDILELCLRVPQVDGLAAAEELELLKKLAEWLEVDADRFRSMVEKILPVGMHEAEDMEVILGVTPDMSRDQAREHLNRQYRKWNARVTSPDPQVQTQADKMLRFIADARREYVA